MGPDAMILVFWMLSFKPTFSLSSLPLLIATREKPESSNEDPEQPQNKLKNN